MLESAEAYGLVFRFPAGDTAVGASLRDHGEFAKPELDFLLACAGDGPATMLDVGANIGAISLPFAMARPQWRVIAVEAHVKLAALVSAGASANGLGNVEVLNAAAGPEQGSVDYPDPDLDLRLNYGDLGLHLREPASTRRVVMRSLDSFAPADTRVVKMDVQGFEPAVLAGAHRLRQEVRPIWLVEACPAFPEAGAEVIRILQGDGYSLFWFYSPFVTAAPRRGAPPQNPTVGDSAVVAIPPGAASPWPLLPVKSAEEARPGYLAAYSYLARYGYALGPPATPPPEDA